ncbi:MAG TPA: mandelate racemase/muconate lactonizing enzyme family protein [Planctomycetota bacterium]|jgi:galactonate dehydratase
MKITAVKSVIAAYGIRNVFMVKIETDSGLHGWGEGGISGRETGMAAIVDSFAPHLLGEDPRRIDRLWQIMFRGGFFESGTVMSGAISAVDLALWDLLGKHLKVPCWQLLGGRSRDRIECYLGASLESAKQRVKEGWRALRMEPAAGGAGLRAGGQKRKRKVGGARREQPYAGAPALQVFEPDAGLRSAIEIMRQARQLVGDEIRLCMDFHTRFNPPAAAQACAGIAPMQPFFIEDPLRSPSPKAYVAFRKRTTVPLAVGEECSSKWEFQQLIEEDAIDFARIDVCNVGGLTESRKVAAMAEAHYIDVIPHNPLGPISTAACIHLAAALPNFMILEYGIGPDRAPDLFRFSHRFKAPHYEIPETPGLGVDVIESTLPAHAPVPWLCPQLQRADGSFTNW